MAGAPTQTTLNAFQLEAGCGWGGPQGLFFSESFEDNITATPGGTQANARQLTRQNSRVTTVASPADAVMLPPALPGLELVLVNHGVNSMQVYGNGTRHHRRCRDGYRRAADARQHDPLLLYDARKLVHRGSCERICAGKRRCVPGRSTESQDRVPD
jgi:hypothetical protein